MEIAVISDTHLPRASRRLPERCVSRLKAAELILHAGDFVRVSVLHELERYGQVIAVHGNVDEDAVRNALPRTATLEAVGARIGLIHDAGPTRGRLERLRRRFPDADAVIFGHSHLPLYERAPEGFQIFNPGSPTERRRAPHHTMGLLSAERGGLAFRLIALD